MIAKDKTILLASKSPRRQQLIKELGINYKLINIEVEEDFPEHLKAQEIPLYLCELKANGYTNTLADDEILLTADTVVWINDKVLNKPLDRKEAYDMISLLSGKKHEVYTAICLKTNKSQQTFYDVSSVYFNVLTEDEINYYIDNYSPYDKAGAYGIQEWIGYVAIKKIDGDFFNVMGLPVQLLYKKLKELFNA